MAIEFDSFDITLLTLLASDAGQPLADLARQTNLSTNACWRRVKRLEEQGVILRKTIEIDHRKLGLNLTAFVSLRTSSHSTAWLETFSRHIRLIPQVVECHRMAGEVDYLLKVVVSDIAEYDDVYKRIIDMPEITDVSGAFSMEALKRSQAPLRRLSPLSS